MPDEAAAAAGPPRVLLLRPLLAQRNRSMDRYADELGAALRARGDFEVHDATLAPPGAAIAMLPGAVQRRIDRFIRYRGALRGERADVYHIVDHSYGDLAGALPPERTIVTCHDLVLLRAQRGALGFRGGRITERLFRHRVAHLRSVAHVACISQQTRNDLIELVGVDPERTSVIPNGVDERFRPLPAPRRTALRAAIAPPERPLILHVSTGAAYKNVEGTLATLAALRATGVDALLLRAGQPLRPEQAALARSLGVTGAVRDLGRVDDARLVELYNAVDVLLFPSHYEGFGWPPLEAMACGTPVVTSKAPALLEVTGDAALHAPAGDAEALARCLRAILEDAERGKRLRAAGLARAAGYRWEETAAAFAERYGRVLDAARG